MSGECDICGRMGCVEANHTRPKKKTKTKTKAGGRSMSWHYGIVSHVHAGEIWFGLHEVYVNGGTSWTVNPTTFTGQTVEEIVEMLQLAVKDAQTRGVIDEAAEAAGGGDE